jgi:uncharacterized protein YggE
MKYIFALILFSGYLIVSAQQMPRTIEVIGIGNYKVLPDIAIMSINISSVNIEYDKTIVGLKTKVDEAQEYLTGLSFKAEEIKTKDYEISVNQVYKNNQAVDSGYRGHQLLEVRFPNKVEYLHNVLKNLLKNKTAFFIRFEFELSDSLKAIANSELIKLATRDATLTSKLIEESSGVNLKEIMSISYGHYSEDSMRELKKHYNVAYAYNVNQDANEYGFIVEEIVLTDNVTIKWRIE